MDDSILVRGGQLIDVINPDYTKKIPFEAFLGIKTEKRFANQSSKSFTVFEHTAFMYCNADRFLSSADSSYTLDDIVTFQLVTALHDLVENFTRDIPTPIKQNFYVKRGKRFVRLSEFENVDITRYVYHSFGLDYTLVDQKYIDWLKVADRITYQIECEMNKKRKRAESIDFEGKTYLYWKGQSKLLQQFLHTVYHDTEGVTYPHLRTK